MFFKLENIFKSIILEQKALLLESVSREDVIEAIDSNYRYRIWYQGEKETGSAGLRFVDFYVLGVSKAGNDVARVFQAGGYSTSDRIGGGWKLLRLDRIHRMEKTGHHVGLKSIDKYNASLPPFNETGDKLMSSVTYIAKFPRSGD